MSSTLNRVFKCLSCECELEDTVYGAYCERCLNYDASMPVLVSREQIFSNINKEACVEITEETCEETSSNISQTEDFQFDMYDQEHAEKQLLIDAQHALNDNEEYTEEENAEYFRLNPQPPLERMTCVTYHK